MATDVSDRVREIARYREAEESEIIQQAVEDGVENLWRDVVISKYLDGEISREEAVDELGADVVRPCRPGEGRHPRGHRVGPRRTPCLRDGDGSRRRLRPANPPHPS